MPAGVTAEGSRRLRRGLLGYPIGKSASTCERLGASPHLSPDTGIHEGFIAAPDGRAISRAAKESGRSDSSRDKKVHVGDTKSAFPARGKSAIVALGLRRLVSDGRVHPNRQVGFDHCYQCLS
jgi:hypothetical protein